MKTNRHLCSLALALALVPAVSSAQAAPGEFYLPQVQPSVVTPGDTFSFDIAGFYSGGTTGYLLTGALTATFGTTQTFIGAGPNGQNITITSSETSALTGVTGPYEHFTSTDTFTVSTPTNFLTTATFSGVTINTLQLDLGDSNSGGNTIATLDGGFGQSVTGSVTYSTNSTLAVTPTTTFYPSIGYSASEGVTSGGAISSLAVHSFTYTVNYQGFIQIPEPSTWALLGVGAGGLGLVLRQHRRVWPT